MSYEKKELFTLQESLGSFPGFGGIHAATYISKTRVSYKKQELLTLEELLCSHPGFGRIRVVTYISITASVL